MFSRGPGLCTPNGTSFSSQIRRKIVRVYLDGNTDIQQKTESHFYILWLQITIFHLKRLTHLCRMNNMQSKKFQQLQETSRFSETLFSKHFQEALEVQFPNKLLF